MAEKYGNYTRSELIDELRLKEASLMEWKIKPDPTEGDKKTEQTAIIASLEETVTALRLKVNSAIVPVGGATSNSDVMERYASATKRQLVAQYVQNVGILQIQRLENWICEFDRIKSLEVDEAMEGDFVKMVKRQLPQTVFSTLNESEEATDTWATLRCYLVKHFGSKISVFQHLTKLHDLQLQRGESVSTFASKLEEKLFAASVHVMKTYRKENNNAEMTTSQVFKLLGASLLSVQVRNAHPSIYRSMIKSMDKHWTATSLASEAQDYLDRLGPSMQENQTFMAQPKKKIESTKTKTSTDADKGSKRSTKGNNSLEKLKEKVKDQICREFAESGTCKYGERCFRRHEKTSYYTSTTKRDARFDELFSKSKPEHSYMVQTSNLKDSIQEVQAESKTRPSAAYCSIRIQNEDGSKTAREVPNWRNDYFKS